MITYNHGAFICQAIESVLNQKTSFPVELVIGEDCSTDNTRSIAVHYRDLYPDRIRLLLPEANIGMQQNFVQTYRTCSGQYIAMLEGDDYWTSEDKLQKQVDFMKAHPECTICFHDAEALDILSGEKTPYREEKPAEITTLPDLLKTNYLPTCATMYRNNIEIVFPDWFYTLKMCDWPMHVFYAEHGAIGYIDADMATYRMHPGGVWSLKDPVWTSEELVKMYHRLDEHLKFRFTHDIHAAISLCNRYRGYHALRHKKYDIAWKMYMSALRSNPRFLADRYFCMDILSLCKQRLSSRRSGSRGA
jgi:glycosyltransferase involved in cell wall biosynthesis